MGYKSNCTLYNPYGKNRKVYNLINIQFNGNYYLYINRQKLILKNVWENSTTDNGKKMFFEITIKIIFL